MAASATDGYRRSLELHSGIPWGGASVSSGLGSAGASIGHHASVNDVRESAFEAAQRPFRLLPAASLRRK